MRSFVFKLKNTAALCFLLSILGSSCGTYSEYGDGIYGDEIQHKERYFFKQETKPLSANRYRDYFQQMTQYSVSDSSLVKTNDMLHPDMASSFNINTYNYYGRGYSPYYNPYRGYYYDYYRVNPWYDPYYEYSYRWSYPSYYWDLPYYSGYYYPYYIGRGNVHSSSRYTNVNSRRGGEVNYSKGSSQRSYNRSTNGGYSPVGTQNRSRVNTYSSYPNTSSESRYSRNNSPSHTSSPSSSGRVNHSSRRGG